MTRVTAIGECMLELSGELGGEARLGYGGDTLNTSVYLSRLGVAVSYLTALGNDPWSDALRQNWQAEGVDCDLVLTHPDRVPGLYAIRVDAAGERSFTYWRSQSAARALFDCPGIDAALVRAARCDVLYVSGITLSLFAGSDLDRLFALFQDVRARGGQVVFDPNYRPRGWQTAADAQAAFETMMGLTSVGLPTFDDEAALFGDASPEETRERWEAAGVGEVTVKLGGEGALVGSREGAIFVPTHQRQVPVDTTGAGDSFNAAYIAARLRGQGPEAAARSGHRLAGAVVMSRGAILARHAMPDRQTA